jgi:outer membrane protein OmpA-like peptidoglycan-associated protein
VEVQLGARLKLLPIPLYFTVGAGTALSPGFRGPLFRGVFNVEFAHVIPTDRDHDGLSNAQDACPDDPEDFDDFEDEDGCPEIDNDQDRILDVDDACPNEPEVYNELKDEDGCPDGDRDGDRIEDSDDACPDEAESNNGIQDEDGCPEPDSDGDGLVDPVDQCPQEPETVNDIDDEDGCPEPDQDGDGIIDARDQCPAEAEVFNGIDDEDGCPDKSLVVMEKKDEFVKIEILEKVYFATGRDTIKRRSYAVLDAVVQLLQSYPMLTLVEVQGHTDSQGDAQANLDLSQRRAEAVVRYLIAHGVEPERVFAAGYGESKPIDTNATRAGRANNRRVEFVKF